MSTQGTASSVERIMELLLTDPLFVIGVTVRNNPAAVAANYQAVMGVRSAPKSDAMVSRLQRMWEDGQRDTVGRIIAVPWVDQIGTPLQSAVQALRAEGMANANTAEGMAMLKHQVPLDLLAELDAASPQGNPNAAPNATTNTGSTGSTAGGSSWLESLPGILTAAGGLVGAFTGNLPGGGTNSNAPQPPTPNSGGTMRTVLIILGIGAAVVAAALAIRYFRKKK